MLFFSGYFDSYVSITKIVNANTIVNIRKGKNKKKSFVSIDGDDCDDDYDGCNDDDDDDELSLPVIYLSFGL